MKEYSLEVVQAYMGHIQTCAEQAVRQMLRLEQSVWVVFCYEVTLLMPLLCSLKQIESSLCRWV